MKNRQLYYTFSVLIVAVALLINVGTIRQVDASTQSVSAEKVAGTQPDLVAMRQEIVLLSNKVRTKAGVKKLVVNKTVQQAAQRKADEMARTGEFSHFLSSGMTPWSELQTRQFAFSSAGENLAVHFTKPEELVKAWYDSPTHRANLVSRQFTTVGIGISKGVYEGEEGYFFVQLLVKPN